MVHISMARTVRKLLCLFPHTRLYDRMGLKNSISVSQIIDYTYTGMYHVGSYHCMEVGIWIQIELVPGIK